MNAWHCIVHAHRLQLGSSLLKLGFLAVPWYTHSTMCPNTRLSSLKPSYWDEGFLRSVSAELSQACCSL